MRAACAAALAVVGLCAAGEARSTAGAVFGLTRSELGGDLADGGVDEPGLGFSGGVYVEQPLGRAASFRIEALYSQWNVEGDSLGASVTVDTSWLEIPVLVVTEFADLRVYAGGSVALNIDASGTASGGMFPGIVQALLDASLDNLEDEEYGVVFGLNYEFYAGRTRMSVDLRYKVGLSDIDSSDAEETTIDVFSLRFGFAF